MKKLIPAICMTLLAAAMFATSTFAWFSMNTTVQATGMKVTAKSDSTFLIIQAGSGAWDNSSTATSADTSSTTKELFPVAPKEALTSTNVTTPGSWHYAYSNSNTDPNKTGEYIVCTDLTNYVASEVFQIGLNEKSSVDTSENNIKLTFVTLPENKGISCVIVCGTVCQTYTATNLSANLDLGAKAQKDSSVTVTVYYFINGEDEHVYTNNAGNLTGSINLVFSIA